MLENLHFSIRMNRDKIMLFRINNENGIRDLSSCVSHRVITDLSEDLKVLTALNPILFFDRCILAICK